MKQLNKWYCIVFSVVLLSFCVINVVTPQIAFSQNENRTLAQFPIPTVESVLSGDFMTDFESYSTDQFIGRDIFITAKAEMERATGKKENNGVYFGKEDYLIQKIPAIGTDILDANINSIRKLDAADQFNIHLGLVPTAYEIEQDKLPAYAYVPIQREIVEEVSKQLSGTNVNLIDPLDAINEHKGEYLYYRTDHHQTAYGGYYTYRQLAKQMGLTPYDITDFTVKEMSDAFYGTTWSEATLPDVTPDSIYQFQPNFDISFQTEFVGEDKSLDGLYDLEALSQKDKYVMYLGGNHALTKITSSLKNGKKLAVFKDSYAHNIVPFLANHYEEVHMIDPRYYNMDPVSYLQENEISDVLVLYSAPNFAVDTNVVKIGAFVK